MADDYHPINDDAMPPQPKAPQALEKIGDSLKKMGQNLQREISLQNIFKRKARR